MQGVHTGKPPAISKLRTSESAAISLMAGMNVGCDVARSMELLTSQQGYSDIRQQIRESLALFDGAVDTLRDLLKQRRPFNHDESFVARHALKLIRTSTTQFVAAEDHLVKVLYSSGLLEALDRHRTTLLGLLWSRESQRIFAQAEPYISSEISRDALTQIWKRFLRSKTEITQKWSDGSVTASVSQSVAQFQAWMPVLLDDLEKRLQEGQDPPPERKLTYIIEIISAIPIVIFTKQLVMTNAAISLTALGIVIATISVLVAVWVEVLTVTYIVIRIPKVIDC